MNSCYSTARHAIDQCRLWINVQACHTLLSRHDGNQRLILTCAWASMSSNSSARGGGGRFVSRVSLKDAVCTGATSSQNKHKGKATCKDSKPRHSSKLTFYDVKNAQQLCTGCPDDTQEVAMQSSVSFLPCGNGMLSACLHADIMLAHWML